MSTRPSVVATALVMFALVIVSLLALVGSTGRDDADILAPFREGDMIEIPSQGTEHMKPRFPIVPPCIFSTSRRGSEKHEITSRKSMPCRCTLLCRFVSSHSYPMVYCMYKLSVLSSLALTLCTPSWRQLSLSLREHDALVHLGQRHRTVDAREVQVGVAAFEGFQLPPRLLLRARRLDRGALVMVNGQSVLRHQ